MLHSHLIDTTTEAFEGIEASLVKDDLVDRIEFLLALVVVHEVDRGAFRVVGAVEQHVHRNVTFGQIHILIEAVRPDNHAFARLLDGLGARTVVVTALAAAATAAATTAGNVEFEQEACRRIANRIDSSTIHNDIEGNFAIP